MPLILGKLSNREAGLIDINHDSETTTTTQSNQTDCHPHQTPLFPLQTKRCNYLWLKISPHLEERIPSHFIRNSWVTQIQTFWLGHTTRMRIRKSKYITNLSMQCNSISIEETLNTCETFRGLCMLTFPALIEMFLIHITTLLLMMTKVCNDNHNHDDDDDEQLPLVQLIINSSRVGLSSRPARFLRFVWKLF